MVEYLLVLHLCNNVDGDCMWTRIGRYRTEQACLTNGLSAEPPGSQFKCVLQAAPDLVPLPRSRPGPQTD